MKSNTQKIVTLGLFLAIAIILNIVENITINIIFIPGIKLGLANISMIFILYFYGYKEMFATNVLRIVVANLITGQLFGMPFVISMASGLFSMLIILPIYKSKVFSIYGISMTQAITFNFAQITTVSLLYSSTVFFYYLPYLLLTGVVTGFLVAFIAVKIIYLMRHTLKPINE
ncbi:Gx transporter family protein [Mycoplasma sp. P36-A1]|uniref:Gx transporter family protein n=1 Tax=Mycoplasma sp. P36-A1 TaxID=3252900 RepID=UPI003C2CB90B